MFVGEDAFIRQSPTLWRMLAVVSLHSCVDFQQMATLQTPVASSLLFVVLLRTDIVVVNIHTPFVPAKVQDCERLAACKSFCLFAHL